MLIDDLKDYCHELTGHPVAVVPDAAANGLLPLFLAQLYEPHRAELFGQSWTMLLFRRRNTPTPAEVAGHARAADQAVGQEVVFVFPKLASYERNRLVQKGVRFIVPYSQVFLPGAMVALKEQQAPADSRPEKAVLSAPAQLLVLFHLQRREAKESLPLCEWAKVLGYSRMTLTRVCDELAQAGLAQKVGRGRVVVIELAADGRELWEMAVPKMISPVMKRIHVRWRGNRPVSPWEAGLTALAKYSDLAPGKESMVAMTPATFREALSHHLLEPEPYAEPETAEVELWRYEPGLLSMDGNMVDPLSLYLSLRGTSDERIEAALADVLKGIKW